MTAMAVKSNAPNVRSARTGKVKIAAAKIAVARTVAAKIVAAKIVATVRNADIRIATVKTGTIARTATTLRTAATVRSVTFKTAATDLIEMTGKSRALKDLNGSNASPARTVLIGKIVLRAKIAGRRRRHLAAKRLLS